MGQDITERLAVSYPDKPSYGDLIEAIDTIKSLRAENAVDRAEAQGQIEHLDRENHRLRDLCGPLADHICLLCGRSEPCMTDEEARAAGVPGAPCTFDPTPRQLWDDNVRLRTKAAAFEQAWKDACTRAERAEGELAESKKLLDIALPNDDDKRFMQFIGDTLKLATSTVETQTAAITALKALLRELVILEADGKHADESAIEVWDRARAVLGEGE